MKKLLLFVLIPFLMQVGVYAQDIFYIDQDSVIMTLDGVLYDSGGPDGDYSNSEDNSCLINAYPGHSLVLLFEEFDLESSYDVLTVYDGNSENDPILVQSSGNEIEGYTITPESGQAFVTFTSDGSVSRSGFKIVIGDTPFSQDFNISWLPQDGNDFSSVLHFCQPDTMRLNVETMFYQNNQSYYQTVDSVTYEWSVFLNEDSVFYQSDLGLDSLSFPFEAQGLYHVNLTAFDQNENMAGNSLDCMFTYGPEPDFSAVNYPDTVCQGTLFEFVINQNEFAPNFSLNTFASPLDTAYIPDGSGAEYEFDLPVIASPVSFVNTASDLEGICVNIEHSYVGDLDIWIECPNGQTSYLFEQACGNCAFGHPEQDDNPIPGIGYDYCWTMDADSTMSEICPPNGEPFPEGDYLPVDSYESLIGCPLSGVWTLHILDNLSIDNGYIFDFNIQFADYLVDGVASGLYSNMDYSYSPDNPTFAWEGNQIVEVQGGNAQVLAMESGLQNYHLAVENGSGCVYETDYQVYVLPESDADCCVSVFAGIDEIVCGTQFDLHAQTNADSLYWSVFSGPGNASFTDSTLTNTMVQADSLGLYTFVCHAFNTIEGCYVSDTLVVEFVDQQIDPMFNMLASDLELRADFVYSGEFNELASYNWIIPEAESIVGYGVGPVSAYFSDFGVYEVGLSVEYGCVSDTNYVSFELINPNAPEYIVTVPSCNGASDGSILVVHDSIHEVYVNNQLSDTLITGLTAGMYNLSVVTSEGITFYQNIEIIAPDPYYGDVLIQSDFVFCGDSITVELSDELFYYSWGVGGVSNPPVFYEPIETWVSARDSQNCLYIDSLNIYIDDYTVEPLIAGYTEDEEFLATWFASENVLADSLDLFVWNETLPPLMITKTAIADLDWVGEIADYTAQYFYVQHENSCQDTLTSELINVLSLIDGGGKSSELQLYWQVSGYEFFDSEMKILTDEVPFDEFLLYDTHPLSEPPYLFADLEHTQRIRLQADFLEPIIVGEESYSSLYSNPLYYQAESISDIENAFMVYPNPFDDRLICRFGQNISETISIQISDGLGRIVYEKICSNAQAGDEMEIDTEQLKSGLYVLQIKSTSFCKKRKLVKR